MDYLEQASNVFTAVRSVNKTDVHTLLDQFGSVRDVVCSSVEEMSLCPGLGEKKVRRLWEAFRKPFSSLASKKRKRDRVMEAMKRQKEQEEEAETEEKREDCERDVAANDGGGDNNSEEEDNGDEVEKKET
eukprot:10177925-Ditylum_brightwellii.AAC.1